MSKNILPTEPCWSATIRLTFSHHNIGAQNEKGVRESIKETFYDEYHLIIEDYEITDIQRDDEPIIREIIPKITALEGERCKVCDNILQECECKHFLNDDEKMIDYWQLTKEQFLKSYSYLTEGEYELTRKLMRNKCKKKGGKL